MEPTNERIRKLSFDAYNTKYNAVNIILCDEFGFDNNILYEKYKLHQQLERQTDKNVQRLCPIPTPGNGWCLIFSIIGGLLTLDDPSINRWLEPESQTDSIESWMERFSYCVRILDDEGFFENIKNIDDVNIRREIERDLTKVKETRHDLNDLNQSLGSCFVDLLTEHLGSIRLNIYSNNDERQQIPEPFAGLREIHVFHSGVHFTLLLKNEFVFMLRNGRYPILKKFLRATTIYMKKILKDYIEISQGLKERIENLREEGKTNHEIEQLLCDEYKSELIESLESKKEESNSQSPFTTWSHALKIQYKDLGLKIKNKNDTKKIYDIVNKILREVFKDQFKLPENLGEEFYNMVSQMDDLIQHAEKFQDQTLESVNISDSELKILGTLEQDMSSLSQQILDHLVALSVVNS